MNELINAIVSESVSLLVVLLDGDLAAFMRETGPERL